MMNAAARSFTDLIVWQKAHQLALTIYRYCDKLPKKETYILISQMTRSGVSVPANIAEGFKRRTKPDKIRHLNIGQASLEETRYYLILGNDLGYGNTQRLLMDAEEVSKILDAYIKTIHRSKITSDS